MVEVFVKLELLAHPRGSCIRHLFDIVSTLSADIALVRLILHYLIMQTTQLSKFISKQSGYNVAQQRPKDNTEDSFKCQCPQIGVDEIFVAPIGLPVIDYDEASEYAMALLLGVWSKYANDHD